MRCGGIDADDVTIRADEDESSRDQTQSGRSVFLVSFLHFPLSLSIPRGVVCECVCAPLQSLVLAQDEKEEEEEMVALGEKSFRDELEE